MKQVLLHGNVGGNLCNAYQCLMLCKYGMQVNMPMLLQHSGLGMQGVRVQRMAGQM